MIGLVVAGCQAASPSVPSSPAASNAALGTPATPAASAEPSPTLVVIRACRPGEVAIGGAILRDGLGTDGFVIYNIGPQDCTVEGRASVAILDAEGAPLPLQIQPWETDMPSAGYLLAGQPTPAPRDGIYPGWVGVQLAWSNWCGPAWTDGSLAVTIPNVGNLSASLTGSVAPNCDDRNRPSALIVGPIFGPR